MEPLERGRETSSACDGGLFSHGGKAEPAVLENGSPSAAFEEPKGEPTSSNAEGNAPDRYVHGWKLCIIITSLCFGTFLVALDVSIIGVAIPRITTDFHIL